MGENLMCPAHKAGNKNWYDHYDQIFRKNEEKKMRYCKLCGQKCGEMSFQDWNYEWNCTCDNCIDDLVYTHIDEFEEEI